ncbi:MAG: 5' nucleotidase, NT5C type [Nitrososphaera sp.]
MISTIAFDVDNVLADTASAFCKLANERWQTSYTKQKIKYPKIVGSFRAKPEDIFDLQEEVWQNWKALPPTEPNIGSIIGSLRTKRKKITIATSRTLESIEYVRKWLMVHEVVYDRFCRFGVKESKSTLDADILVDDDQVEIGDFVMNKRGRIGLLYDQPWNNSILPIEGISRIRSLSEILDFLEK